VSRSIGDDALTINQDRSLDGAIAVISGAASEIDEATAWLFAAEIRLNPIRVGSPPAQANNKS
jgi:hypothetical protein